MLDSNDHDDSEKEGESVMGKVAEFKSDRTRHIDQFMWYLYKISEVSGVNPIGFQSLEKYLEAAVATMETESISLELTKGEGAVSEEIKKILRNEIKKRGELS